MTKIQKLLALYGAYAKSVNTHFTAFAAWAVFMLHSGDWPPTNGEWALLITLFFPGVVTAITTNKPLDPPVTTVALTTTVDPLLPVFPPPVGD